MENSTNSTNTIIDSFTAIAERLMESGTISEGDYKGLMEAGMRLYHTMPRQIEVVAQAGQDGEQAAPPPEERPERPERPAQLWPWQRVAIPRETLEHVWNFVQDLTNNNRDERRIEAMIRGWDRPGELEAFLESADREMLQKIFFDGHYIMLQQEQIMATARIAYETAQQRLQTYAQATTVAEEMVQAATNAVQRRVAERSFEWANEQFRQAREYVDGVTSVHRSARRQVIAAMEARKMVETAERVRWGIGMTPREARAAAREERRAREAREAIEASAVEESRWVLSQIRGGVL